MKEDPETHAKRRQEWQVQLAWANNPACSPRDREEIRGIVAEEKERYGE